MIWFSGIYNGKKGKPSSALFRGGNERGKYGRKGGMERRGRDKNIDKEEKPCAILRNRGRRTG